MNYKNYLIFDFGASSGRSIVARYNGDKFNINITHRFLNNPVFVNNTLYWDILRLYFELKIGLRSSIKKYNDITSMAIDSWGLDFCFIDKNGKIISNPIHYRDKKRNSMAANLYKIIPKKELFKLTGGPTLSYASIINMYLLKLERATSITNAYRFLMIPDIFNYFLTGNICNEFTNVSTTTMFNQKDKKWVSKIFNRLDIPINIFPKIIMPGTLISNIDKNVAKEMEIKSIPVIAPATHDTASAVAGIPVVDKNKRWAFINIGTWCPIGIETKNQIISKEAFEEGFFNEGGVAGSNIFFKALTGLWIIQQCRECWIRDKGVTIPWNNIVEKLYQAKPFNSYINVDDSIFALQQPDMTFTIKEYCKKTNQNIPQSIGEVSRCIYESLVLKFRSVLEKIEKFSNMELEILYIMGGGTQNRLLSQWIANACSLNVIVCSVETTSIGNLLMQLKVDKEITDLDEGRRISFNSSKLEYCEPKNKDDWNEAYHKFLKIL